MHDPLTVAHEIKSPFRGKPSQLWPAGYRNTLVTIWHQDPCTDHTDDSCDWFGSKFGWYPAHRDTYNALPEESKRAVDFTLWMIGDRRPWYRHPRWHVWHWQVQVHFLLSFKRWAFSRCAGCNRGFSWGYSPVTYSWNGHGPRWFRSEEGVYHDSCLPVPKETVSDGHHEAEGHL